MYRAWERFWFGPFSVATLVVVRVASGLVALGWTLSLLPDLRTFYSSSGAVPSSPSIPWYRGVLSLADSPGFVVLLWVVTLLACVSLVVGLGGRWAALVAFVAVLSFQRRNPWVLNSGDVLVRLLLLYLVFTPCSAAVSVDRWLASRRGGGSSGAAVFPVLPQVGLRLFQVQLTVVYVATLWSKLRGVTWSDGTAVSYALRIGDLERFSVPSVFTDSLLLMNVVTWVVLLIELALAVLVWNRRLRPWVLLAGVALHLGIELTIAVGFFSFALFAMYCAFLPPPWVERRFFERSAPLSVRGRSENPTTGVPVTPPS